MKQPFLSSFIPSSSLLSNKNLENAEYCNKLYHTLKGMNILQNDKISPTSSENVARIIIIYIHIHKIYHDNCNYKMETIETGLLKTCLNLNLREIKSLADFYKDIYDSDYKLYKTSLAMKKQLVSLKQQLERYTFNNFVDTKIQKIINHHIKLSEIIREFNLQLSTTFNSIYISPPSIGGLNGIVKELRKLILDNYFIITKNRDKLHDLYNAFVVNKINDRNQLRKQYITKLLTTL
jgi:hypothetical protein